jgi:malic enzyme
MLLLTLIEYKAPQPAYIGIIIIYYVIDQSNNSLLYPGLWLGTIVARANHINDGALDTAAEAEGLTGLKSTTII